MSCDAKERERSTQFEKVEAKSRGNAIQSVLVPTLQTEQDSIGTGSDNYCLQEKRSERGREVDRTLDSLSHPYSLNKSNAESGRE